MEPFCLWIYRGMQLLLGVNFPWSRVQLLSQLLSSHSPEASRDFSVDVIPDCTASEGSFSIFSLYCKEMVLQLWGSDSMKRPWSRLLNPRDGF